MGRGEVLGLIILAATVIPFLVGVVMYVLDKNKIPEYDVETNREIERERLRALLSECFNLPQEHIQAFDNKYEVLPPGVLVDKFYTYYKKEIKRKGLLRKINTGIVFGEMSFGEQFDCDNFAKEYISCASELHMYNSGFVGKEPAMGFIKVRYKILGDSNWHSHGMVFTPSSDNMALYVVEPQNNGWYKFTPNLRELPPSVTEFRIIFAIL